jgi:two-component system response regulator (stage 0 sporulation protein A)
MLTVLIATERQRFLHLWDNPFSLSGAYVCYTSIHLRECCKKLQESRPDILLLDISNGEKALYLLDEALKITEIPTPAIFVRLGERNSALEHALLQKGAAHIFDNNMQESIIVDCAMILYERFFAGVKEDGIRPEMTRLLRACGISPKHRGYSFICDSACFMLRENDSGQLLTKNIYPQVAQKNGTTAVRVEKNIRDAIRVSWESGGRESIAEVLGCGGTRPPTNLEFLACVCEKVAEILYKPARS